MKSTIPVKVGVGYVLVSAVLVVAIWLICGNTQELTRIKTAETEFSNRRDMVDSLVFTFLQAGNSERAVFSGKADQWDEFDRAMRQTAQLADSLKHQISDPVMQHKLDTLHRLVMRRRANTLALMATLAQNSTDAYYKQKVKSLQQGKDSVLVHPVETNVKENDEVVYDVVQTRKGFFSRLADAFRRQRKDTVSIRRSSAKAVADSVSKTIDVAHTVASVLDDIRQQQARMQQRQRRQQANTSQQQLLESVRLVSRIEQLLEDLRTDEHQWLQQAFDHDIEARRQLMIELVLMAVVSLLASGILLLFVWRDTHREALQRQYLAEAKDETERVMNQRERLLLTITHDIKAPVASISGFIELLSERMTDAKAQGYLHSIHASATHLLQLVSSLLDYHQLESGKASVHTAEFSPQRVVAQSVEALQPQARHKGLSLAFHADGMTHSLYRGDAFRLKQIVDNLVGNALKYTEEGKIEVMLSLQVNGFRLTVADTGCGMTLDECRRVFQAFTRLPQAQGIEGVGLGLSITHELVNLLHGTIHVHSVKGKGTQFVVVLPCPSTGQRVAAETDTCVAAPQADSHEVPQLACHDEIRLMAVDDNALQLQLLTEMLLRISGGQLHLKTYTDVEEAKKHYDAAPPQLFFIDLEMPRQSGLSFMKSLQRYDHCHLVAMTAHDAGMASSLIAEGFDACLFKPFDLRQLATLVSGLLHVPLQTVPPQPKRHAASAVSSARRWLQPLLAFADGDAAAEQAILGSFFTELDAYVAALRDAARTDDTDAMRRIAHKAMPVLKQIGSPAVAVLQALTAAHIHKLTSPQRQAFCQKAMEEIARLQALKPQVDEEYGNVNKA